LAFIHAAAAGQTADFSAAAVARGRAGKH